MEIVLDASAIIAVIADEPEAEIVINNTQNAKILSPDNISFEVANALTKMMKKILLLLELPLLTFDKNMRKIGMELGIKVLGEKYASI